jgi:hypothetical protein
MLPADLPHVGALPAVHCVCQALLLQEATATIGTALGTAKHGNLATDRCPTN